MPVTRERADQVAVQRAATMALKKLLYESPLGRHVDPWFVEVPQNHPFVPVWADPKKVQRKKIRYHAETVAPKYAMDTYKIPRDQIVSAGTHVERMGLILMHYPKQAHAVRQAYPVVMHMDMVDAEVRRFNANPDAVPMERDADGDLVPARSSGSRLDPRQGKRPRVAMMEDALAAQGLRRRDLDLGESAEAEDI